MGSRAQLAVATRRTSALAQTAAEVSAAKLVELPRTAGRDRTGQILHGTYLIERRIAEGGMGSVYEVRHLRLQQRFAMKVLEHQSARNDEAYARFRQEAEIAASLNHASIVQVFDFNTDPMGNPYMVMELVEGTTLTAFIHGRPLSLSDVFRIIEPLCSALNAAHRAGIVHRDLKPSNVMVVRSSADVVDVKLLDFGISKMRDAEHDGMTRDNVVMGTPNYMSPEQARGLASSVDAKTDIFALGAILYEMLTGRRAFEGSGTPELLHAIVFFEPKPLKGLRPDVPEALVAIVERCLKKDPKERFDNVRELVVALKEAAQSTLPTTPSLRPVTSDPTPSSRRSLVWGIAWALSVATAAVAVSVAVSLSGRGPTETKKKGSEAVAAESRVNPRANEPAFSVDLATPGAQLLALGRGLYRADARGVTFWADPDAAPRARTLPTLAAVTALTTSATGDVLVGQADGTISGWVPGLDNRIWEHALGDEPIMRLAAADDYLAAAVPEGVLLVNSQTGRLLKRFDVEGDVAAVQLSRGPEPRLFIVRDRAVDVIDVDRRRELTTLPLLGVATGARLLVEPVEGDVQLAIDFRQGDWSVRRSYRLNEDRRGKLHLEPIGTERID